MIFLKSFAQRFFCTFTPIAENDNDDAFAMFCGAAGELVQEIEDLVRDTPDGPGWSSILDADRCPEIGLPWLAQWVGVVFDDSLTEDQKREWIKEAEGWNRGTRASMERAIKNTLTGTKWVQINERDTSAYHFSVFTRTSETPDPTATEAALLSQKPGGLQYTYAAIGDWTWLDIADGYTDWADVRDSFASWADVRDDNPI